MAMLVLGLVIFLGIHSTRIFADDYRTKTMARIGEGPWKGVYSLISLVGFVLIVWGFGQARATASAIWAPPDWTRHITITLMLFSLILFGAFLFKKSHVAVAVHHPLDWAVVLWSAGHLLANGSTADLMLFGLFLLWAVADLVSSYGRDVRNAVVYPAPDWGATAGAVAVGIVAFGLLIGGLHLWLFGVSPMAA
jgi:uncharacterized membrane protein